MTQKFEKGGAMSSSENYWFGLSRGCVTSGHFVHWGLFYGTLLSKNQDMDMTFWDHYTSYDFQKVRMVTDGHKYIGKIH